MNIQESLFSMQDSGYRDFHSRLMPTVDKNTVIGVRVPELRKFAKSIYGTPEAEAFLQKLPHTYYEENNLHAFLIEMNKDYDKTLCLLEAFLPYIDNWATCDMLTPKCFKKNLPDIKAIEWMNSSHSYTVRFGIEMLMKFFLDDKFDPKYLDMVASVRSEHYYVKMMIAWYFATALSKQYDEAIKIFTNKKLPVWEHNKAIQKATESLRITPEQKYFLKKLKIK
ncbi:MAG: DNA alkylation repair protein [Clostridia bacterium]|nr:DNA alkylation repair protein [Clostridia bacterium]